MSEHAHPDPNISRPELSYEQRLVRLAAEIDQAHGIGMFLERWFANDATWQRGGANLEYEQQIDTFLDTVEEVTAKTFQFYITEAPERKVALRFGLGLGYVLLEQAKTPQRVSPSLPFYLANIDVPMRPAAESTQAFARKIGREDDIHNLEFEYQLIASAIHAVFAAQEAAEHDERLVQQLRNELRWLKADDFAD